MSSGFYERRILPRLIDWTMRSKDLSDYRRRVIPRARGDVLEVGIGSGLNLPHYSHQVRRVIGIDPSCALLAKAQRLGAQWHFPLLLIRASADAIPLRDAAVDTVVMTWTLCSVPDARRALKDMLRVLKPAGELLFVEHGLAPESNVQKWQQRLDPLWRRISCHLNVAVDRAISDAGFRIRDLKTGYLPRGPKPMTFFYEGAAQRPEPEEPRKAEGTL